MKKESVLKKKYYPGNKHWVIFFAICIISFFAFMHDDILETSNHSYIFLESVFTGKFLDFYNVVIERPFDLYYTNYSHYNFLVYALYGVVILPYYVITKIAGIPPNANILQYLGKTVGLAFFIASIVLVAKIALELGFGKDKSMLAAIAFALSTPAFFSAAVMGQYDSICIFFMLLAVYNLIKGNMWHFVLWTAVGIIFKFFALFIFIPLLLLYEKNIKKIIIYFVPAFLLVLPSSLIFKGNNGSLADFNGIMSERLMAAKMPFGMQASAFLIFYLLLCVLCYLWCPEDKKRASIWVCLTTFSLLFIFVFWHTQWIIAICPFLVLSSLMEKNGTFWKIADMAFYIGFIGVSVMVFPNHFGDNLLSQSVVGICSGVGGQYFESSRQLSYILNKIPYFQEIALVLFSGILIANVILKIPYKKSSLCSYLFKNGQSNNKEISICDIWVNFAISFGIWFCMACGLWLLRFISYMRL